MRSLPMVCVLGLALLGTGRAVHAQPLLAHAAPVPPSPAQITRPRVVVTFANVPEGSPGPAGTTGRRYGGGSYVVGQSAHEMARRVAKQYDLKEVASWPIKALSVHCVVYEIPDGRSVPAVLAELAKDSRVTLAQPLQEFHTLTEAPQDPPYNDPLFDLQTNLRVLDIARAHQRTMGAGVRIGLIDTGVDTSHPDLRGRIIGTHSFVPTRAASPLSYRHGTAMAGVIAAVANNHIGIVGIAPLAQLEVFEACWQLRPGADDAECSTFSLAKALAAALDAHVQLVNLSLAGPEDPLLSELIEAGMRRGMTFVGSAASPEDGFPARIPGMIIAGSTDHGSWPAMLTAPGSHVFTLRPEAQYDFESGTSVAAAEVTGAIALLMSESRSRLSARMISSLLKETATQPAGQGASSSPPALNINAALAELDAEQGRVTAYRKP